MSEYRADDLSLEHVNDDVLDIFLNYFCCNTRDLFYDGAMLVTDDIFEYGSLIKATIAKEGFIPTVKDVSILCFNSKSNLIEAWRVQSLDYDTKKKYVKIYNLSSFTSVWSVTNSFIGASSESQRLVTYIFQIGDRLTQEKSFDHETMRRFEIACRVPYILKKRWAVSVREEGLPGLQFVSDPKGIKELFVDREVPEGKTRRAMLRDWVIAHWRQLRDDPEIETRVRAHLRGHEQFKWCGFDCKIHIPARVITKVNNLKRERQIQRLMGTDRRTRTR